MAIVRTSAWSQEGSRLASLMNEAFLCFSKSETKEHFQNAKNDFEGIFLPLIIGTIFDAWVKKKFSLEELNCIIDNILSSFSSHKESWKECRKRCFPDMKTFLDFNTRYIKFSPASLYHAFVDHPEDAWLHKYENMLNDLKQLLQEYQWMQNHEVKIREEIKLINDFIHKLQSYYVTHIHHLGAFSGVKTKGIRRSILVGYLDETHALVTSKIIDFNLKLQEQIKVRLLEKSVTNYDFIDPIRIELKLWIENILGWEKNENFKDYYRYYQQWNQMLIFTHLLVSFLHELSGSKQLACSLSGIKRGFGRLQNFLTSSNIAIVDSIAKDLSIDYVSTAGVIADVISRTLEVIAQCIREMSAFNQDEKLLSEIVSNFSHFSHCTITTSTFQLKEKRLIDDQLDKGVVVIRNIIRCKDTLPGEIALTQIFNLIDTIDMQKDGMTVINMLRVKILNGKQHDILQALEERGDKMRREILNLIEHGDTHRAQSLLQNSYIRKLRVLFHPDRADAEANAVAEKIAKELSKWLTDIRPEIELALKNKGLLDTGSLILHTVDELINLKQLFRPLDEGIATVQEGIHHVAEVQDEVTRRASELQRLFSEASSSFKPK